VREEVKPKYRLYRRSNGNYYSEDTSTGKQHSLGTSDGDAAERLLHAKNEAHLLPSLNLQIARVYLMAGDPTMGTRTWQDVMDSIVNDKIGSTRTRWEMAIKDKAYASIRDLPILETRADHFLKVMSIGKVATNAYLRRLHNYALGMNWLPWPVLAKKLWPRIVYGEKRAITWDEHCLIVERERNPERRSFYQLAWYVGASQTDLANLCAEDIDWENKLISFERVKTRWRGKQPPIIQFGSRCEAILRSLPSTGPLFPYLRTVRSGDRATEFKQRCEGLGIKGVSLQSYRYAWSERGKKCGYPERWAQAALGHNSKAVHRAYAKKAKVIVPSLEDYEQAYADGKIIPMQLQRGRAAETPAALGESRRGRVSV
jgi:integrase